MCSSLMCIQLTLVGRCDLTWQPISETLMKKKHLWICEKLLQFSSLCNDVHVYRIKYPHPQCIMQSEEMSDANIYFPDNKVVKRLDLFN